MYKISNPKPILRKYNNFLGVDFSSDETMVDKRRSPSACNVWKDYNSALGQAIETRPGLRILKRFEGEIVESVPFHSSIIKIHTFIISEKEFFLLHLKYFENGIEKGKLVWFKNFSSDDRLESFGDHVFVTLLDDIGTEKSEGLMFSPNYYFSDGENFFQIKWENEKLKVNYVRDVAFVPTICLVSRDGVKAEFQDFNLLTGKQKCQYQTKTGEKNYFLYPHFVDRKVYDLKIKINGNDANFTFENFGTDGMTETTFKIVLETAPLDNQTMVCEFCQGFEFLTSEKTFQGDGNTNQFELLEELTSDIENFRITYASSDFLEGVTHALEKIDGKTFVVFSENLSANDVFICAYDQKLAGANEKREVEKCGKTAVFDNRVFFAGGSKKSKFFFSGLNDPTYVPGLNFEFAGGEALDVTSLNAHSNNLILIKKGSGGNGYIFTISGVATGDEVMPKIYRSSLVASSLGGFAGLNFASELVFLSEQGLKCVTRLDLHNERNIEHRSTLVDGRLVNERNLSESVLETFSVYLLILVNGKIYLADSREKSGGEYEWFFWDNIGVFENEKFFPVVSLKSFQGKLYFGTANGCLCVLNTDLVKLSEDSMPLGTGELLSEAYADEGIEIVNGVKTSKLNVIVSFWTTPVDDFGVRNRFKRCNKKGAMADLKSFAHSICKIAVKTNFSDFTTLKRHNGGYFDFSDMDFEDFTFNTSDKNVFYFKPKAKKWERMSVMFFSDELQKPFGVFGLRMEAYTMGYAKERM